MGAEFPSSFFLNSAKRVRCNYGLVPHRCHTHRCEAVLALTLSWILLVHFDIIPNLTDFVTMVSNSNRKFGQFVGEIKQQDWAECINLDRILENANDVLCTELPKVSRSPTGFSRLLSVPNYSDDVTMGGQWVTLNMIPKSLSPRTDEWAGTNRHEGLPWKSTTRSSSNLLKSDVIHINK